MFVCPVFKIIHMFTIEIGEHIPILWNDFDLPNVDRPQPKFANAYKNKLMEWISPISLAIFERKFE